MSSGGQYPPIYHLTHPHYPAFDPPPPKIPPNQPNNPYCLPHLLSRSSEPNFTAPNPPSRITAQKVVLERLIADHDAIKRDMGPLGSLSGKPQPQRAWVIARTDGTARKKTKKFSAVRLLRSMIRRVFVPSFRTHWRGRRGGRGAGGAAGRGGWNEENETGKTEDPRAYELGCPTYPPRTTIDACTRSHNRPSTSYSSISPYSQTKRD